VKPLPRRAVLGAILARAAVCAVPALPCLARSVTLPAAPSDRRFSVLYKGNPIGAHTVLYSSATGETHIKTDIRLQVKAGFLTLFSFSHRSEETWRGGQLMALNSETLEHGETVHVQGSATPEGFRVVSGGDPFIAASSTLTSNSLWTPAVLEQQTLVDAQHGGVMGVSARKLGEEDIAIGGRNERATRYSFITPYIAGTIWYDADKLWVRGEFERDGTKIQYQLAT
jgi:hypothetical protein